MDLVRARQVRRPLDYRVGFGLSPVLWRKVLPLGRAGKKARRVKTRRQASRRWAGGETAITQK